MSQLCTAEIGLLCRVLGHRCVDSRQNLAIHTGAIAEVSQQALATSETPDSPTSVLRLLPPSLPPVNPMTVCQASLAAQAPEQPRSLFAVAVEAQQQLDGDVRQQVWEAVQRKAAAAAEMSSSGSRGSQERQRQEPYSTPAGRGQLPALQQDVAGLQLRRSACEACRSFSPSLADLVGNGPVQELDSVDITEALGDGDMPSPSGSCTASHQHRPHRQPQQPAASASEESCASFSLNVSGSCCLPPLHGKAGRTGLSCISPMASVAGGGSGSYVQPAVPQQQRQQPEAGSSGLGGGTMAVTPVGALLFANSHAQQQQGYTGGPATTNGYTPPKCLDSPGSSAPQQQPYASLFASSSGGDATPSSKFSGKRSSPVPLLTLPIHSPGQRVASASLLAQKNLRMSVLKSKAALHVTGEGTPQASPRIRSAKVTTTSSGCSMESPRQQRLRHAVSEAIDTAEAARSLHAAEQNAALSPLSAAAAGRIDSLAADSTPMSGRRRSGRITSTPLPMPSLGSPASGGSDGNWSAQTGSAVHSPPLRLDSPAPSGVVAASMATVLPKRIDSPDVSAPLKEQSHSALRERCNSMSTALTASAAAEADLSALEARFQKLKRGGGGATQPAPLP